MTGISAFVNGVPREMFNALAEDETEGQALHNLYQARQSAASNGGGSADFDEGMMG